MKTNRAFVAAVLLIAIACTKPHDSEPVTRPVEFTETTYQTLGTFDEFGKPNYLAPRDVITSDLLSFINTNLPQNVDLRTTNPQLLSNPPIADIVISRQSDVYITYVSSETVNTEAFAFYTYPTGKPPASAKDIKTITYIFPNTGKSTTLQPGDKVKIGSFNSGTSIGFVLLQNAWSTAYHDLNNKAVHFCSNDVLNPEVDIALKKHAVFMIYTPENKILIGFENIDRTKPECNHDFNDLVFYATVN
jgi:hypothetical protein